MEPIGIIGHIAIDRIITLNDMRLQLGGPPTYVSLITNLLDTPLKTATKVGGDFPKDYAEELAARGLDVSGSVAPRYNTTRFVLDYTGPERRLGYDSLCAPILPKDVEGLPDATILAPIANEIPRYTLEALDSSVLALDPQGFVRRFERGGSISLRLWKDLGLLRRLSVFKASEMELRLVAGEVGWGGLETLVSLGISVAIETRGGEGAYIRYPNGRMMVPVYKGENIDTTGAGDAFIGGFFSAFASGDDVQWCSSLGSAAASAIIETIGAKINIDRRELIERAEKVQEGIMKLY